MENTARVYIAGHNGLIGSAMCRRLLADGYRNVVVVDHDDLELTDSSAVDRFFDQNKPEYVVLAAGRVGGIVENDTFPADFIMTNLAIQLNVLHAAHRTRIKKLILFGSSCMYPRESSQSMTEDMLLAGKPEPTSLAYAISKLAGVQMCLAYNQQYGEKRFIPVIPNSVFGPNDNFDPQSGHVLSALIHRFHEARAIGRKKLLLWGSGSPRREFIFSDDLADACLLLLKNDVQNLDLPVNIGVGFDYSIKALAGMIAGLAQYSGQIEWDFSKPDGVPRKLLDSSRINGFGWRPSVSFEEGLRKTNEWYLSNADD